jgi:signal transduction histidine kinase
MIIGTEPYSPTLHDTPQADATSRTFAPDAQAFVSTTSYALAPTSESIAEESTFTIKVFEQPYSYGILPRTNAAETVHYFTMYENSNREFDTITTDTTENNTENTTETKYDIEATARSFEPGMFPDYAFASAFHWHTAARLAASVSHREPDENAEVHWNVVLAHAAATGVIVRSSASLSALLELTEVSDRARQIAYFTRCITFPTVETYSESLTRHDLKPIERLTLTYGEACCYASRKDEERFEHSAEKFINLCDENVPAMSAPAYHLLVLLRQFGKATSEAAARIKAYLYDLRTRHPSPFVRLHTEILYEEDMLNFEYWTGSVKQKIEWTHHALRTLNAAIALHVPPSWYSYLQYTIAQRSAYSGIYDVARQMIEGMEQHDSLYALVARGYYWAEQEKYDKSAAAYQELIERIEKENTAAARSRYERIPAIRQNDVAFCYYYAAQAMFNIRSTDDQIGLCASYIEKFFLWSEYLSLSARLVLQKICRAMQSELMQDLAQAAAHYEEYVNLLAEDDYISKIKTLSHLAQLYAQQLQNFTKADEHLQALKQLLPQIQPTSVVGLDSDESTTDIADTRAAQIQLWLTRYSLKATQKVMSSLDSVTNQLGGAYQMLEMQNGKLVEVNHSLVELNNEKNEFLGIVAHDLKNPLASILLGVEMLQRYHDRMPLDQQLKKLEDMRTTSRRMQAIITNLLDVNAVDTGKFHLAPARFNISTAVRMVVDDYIERALVKGIILHYEAESNVMTAFADSNATIQILDNLVSNAVKYSPFNTNVWVTLRSHETKVHCLVRDEGPGLSEEDKKKLFGKYARLSAKPTGGEHSTGLGLSIVKKLAEAMGGTVWCESKLGAGATFVVELPISGVVQESQESEESLVQE